MSISLYHYNIVNIRQPYQNDQRTITTPPICVCSERERERPVINKNSIQQKKKREAKVASGRRKAYQVEESNYAKDPRMDLPIVRFHATCPSRTPTHLLPPSPIALHQKQQPCKFEQLAAIGHHRLEWWPSSYLSWLAVHFPPRSLHGRMHARSSSSSSIQNPYQKISSTTRSACLSIHKCHWLIACSRQCSGVPIQIRQPARSKPLMEQEKSTVRMHDKVQQSALSVRRSIAKTRPT